MKELEIKLLNESYRDYCSEEKNKEEIYKLLKDLTKDEIIELTTNVMVRQGQELEKIDSLKLIEE